LNKSIFIVYQIVERCEGVDTHGRLGGGG
jgi:hypothetical protein